VRQGSYLALGAHGFHRVAYTEWGDPGNDRVVVCVHGLTRNGRDFDWLARGLSDGYRVVCPDIVGRGASEWLEQKESYGYPQYLSDMAALLAHLHAESVHWVGTSMGGLIGMLLAAKPSTPIAKLVMNDIGPVVPKAALERIVSYVGDDPRFATMEELDAYLGEIYAPFGPFTEAQWQGLVESTARALPGGEIGLAYDPGIAVPMKAMPLEDVELWSVWESVSCPVLLIRGGQSDVLLAETAEQMTARGPRAELVEYPDIGHAPSLMSDELIDRVAGWLSS
jgi:pimeloyl-ACP methyl ester carboxylesterase